MPVRCPVTSAPQTVCVISCANARFPAPKSTPPKTIPKQAKSSQVVGRFASRQKTPAAGSICGLHQCRLPPVGPPRQSKLCLKAQARPSSILPRIGPRQAMRNGQIDDGQPIWISSDQRAPAQSRAAGQLRTRCAVCCPMGARQGSGCQGCAAPPRARSGHHAIAQPQFFSLL